MNRAATEFQQRSGHPLDGTHRVLRGSTNGLLCRLHRNTGFAFTECYEAETRQLFVSVVSRINRPVRNLQVNEVVLEQDGATCTVIRLESETDKLKIALLVDNSKAARFSLNPLRTGLRDFLDALPAQHEVGLFTLAGQTRQRVNFTTDRDVLREQAVSIFADPNAGSV